MERIEGCIANAEHDDEHETFIDARDKINAQAAEIERLRNWSLKALTVVLCGEGWIMSYPHYDADDLLCDGVELLGVYSAEDARAALGETK
jgi:hypothetical protein